MTHFSISLFHSKKTFLIVLFFTLFFSILTVPNLINQNLIGDEAVYIVEGDRYIHQPYSFYHNSGSPMFLKIVTALPYAALPLDRVYSPYYKQIFTNVYKVGEFVYGKNSHYAHLIIVLARIPHLLISILLGITLFLWSKKYFGFTVASVALAFYTFHATFLAHASTANLDIGVTAFTFWTLALWYLYLSLPEGETLTTLLKVKVTSRSLYYFTGVMLGITQATKISAILLYPFFILSFFFIKNNKRFRDVVGIFLLSGAVLWAIYLFQIGPILTIDDTPAGIESLYGSLPILSNYKSSITQLLYAPIYPLGAYFNNFTYQFSHSFYGHTNYINGVFTDQGIWYYIPLVFLIKNSLILVVSSILGLTLLFNYRSPKYRIYLYQWVWVFVVLIWSMQSKIQLGMRYVLPLFPFLFVCSAAGITYWAYRLLKRRYVMPVIIVFISLYALSTFRVGNNYFTYISELYRGHNPVDLVFDSDYDWGQNVYTLSSQQKKNNLYPLYFRPYIGGSLTYENIQNVKDPREAFSQKLNGYYAFSHSSLVNARKDDPALFSYFYSKRPTYIISKTIYVYKITFP